MFPIKHGSYTSYTNIIHHILILYSFEWNFGIEPIYLKMSSIIKYELKEKLFSKNYVIFIEGNLKYL